MQSDTEFDLHNLTMVTSDCDDPDAVSVKVYHLTDDACDTYDSVIVRVDNVADIQALFPRLGYWSASHTYAAHEALRKLDLDGYKLIGSYFGHKCAFVGVKS